MTTCPICAATIYDDTTDCGSCGATPGERQAAVDRIGPIADEEPSTRSLTQRLTRATLHLRSQVHPS